MQSYDPNAGLDMLKDMPPPPSEDKKSTVPTGLLRFEPENKVEESQMADFSSPIEEVMAGPGQMMQDEVMGPPKMQGGNRPTAKTSGEGKKSSSKNPFGLTDEQFQAAMAGAAAVIAFSKPVQTKLTTMVPRFLTESGDMSITGMIVSALVAALVFFFAKQYVVK